MSQILKCFSLSFLLFLTTDCSTSVASDFQVKGEFNLAQQKQGALRAFNCSSIKDKYCREIEVADNERALMTAIQNKRTSDEKRTAERISVLECCVKIDEKDTCSGLTPEAKEDLDACRKTIKKD